VTSPALALATSRAPALNSCYLAAELAARGNADALL